MIIKQNIVKATILGVAFTLLCSGCILSNAKPNDAPNREESGISQNANKKQNKDSKSLILNEKNGIVISISSIKEDKLLRNITVDMRGKLKKSFLWNTVMDTSRPPIIDEIDVNANGTKEIVIHMNAGTGIGVAINEVHILDPNSLEELNVEDPVQRLNNKLNSSIKHQTGKTYIDTELDGKHLSKMYDYDIGSWGERVSFGSIVSYEIQNGRLRANLAGQASMSEFPVKVVVDYNSDLTIENFTLFYSGFLQPQFSEEDVKSMLDHWLPEGDWIVERKDNQYVTSYPNHSSDGESMMISINPMTGTVHDTTSGSPLKSLANVDAPDLFQISNGTKYMAELYRLGKPILEAAGLKPASKDWITGFLGDGYVLGEVIRSNLKFMIKVDVFTGQWEKISDPFQ
ncbi:hypothetical protein [Paenibacillus sp. FSL K6-2862]|uniref:hypothetical protein n=1 Tax=Paenibacillus sp. FSL K6-2862 TaxID=2921484 RepID=UPI0030F8C16B